MNLLLLLLLSMLSSSDSKMSMSRGARGARSISRVAQTRMHTSSRRRRMGPAKTAKACNGQYNGKYCCKRGVIVNNVCYTNTDLDNNSTLCYKRYNKVINGTCTLVNPITLWVDTIFIGSVVMVLMAICWVFVNL